MFRAFSDPTRLRILHLLAREGQTCVGDLVGALGVPQPRVSRHLAYLRRARLVVVRRERHWRHYSLARAGTSFHRSLLACLSGCFGGVPALAEDRERYARLKAGGGCCPPE